MLIDLTLFQCKVCGQKKTRGIWSFLYRRF